MKGCVRMKACYQCFREKGDMSTTWESCVEHKPKLKSKKSNGKPGKGTVKAKNVRITDDVSEAILTGSTSTTSFSGVSKLFCEASTAVEGISGDIDLTGLFYHDCFETTSKTNATLSIDSGAARSTVPSTLGLQNIQRLDSGITLEYSNGEKGDTIVREGSLFLNGHELRAWVSPDLRDGLLSTSQLDRGLNATTVQSYGRSISFVPDQRQEQILQMLFEEMSPENVIANGEMNEDGLYEVKVSRDSASEEQRYPELLSSMVINWPTALTPEVIGDNFPCCKACAMSFQKNLPFLSRQSREIAERRNHVPISAISVPGQMGQMDMWGPYPSG